LGVDQDTVHFATALAGEDDVPAKFHEVPAHGQPNEGGIGSAKDVGRVELTTRGPSIGGRLREVKILSDGIFGGIFADAAPGDGDSSGSGESRGRNQGGAISTNAAIGGAGCIRKELAGHVHQLACAGDMGDQ